MKSIVLSVCGLLACVAGAFPLNPSFTSEAVAAYKAKADAGDAEAQYLLGFMYQMGKGVETNLTEAVRLYRKSAEQGNARGQCALGLMYSFGTGVKTNQAEEVSEGTASAEKKIGVGGPPQEMMRRPE